MKVSVIGQGFVGLSLSLVLASKKIHVNAIDIDQNKISILKKGKSTFYEPKLDNFLKNCLKSGTIQFYDSINQAKTFGDIIFVCVPTPNKDGKINLDFLRSVLKILLPSLKKMKTKPVVVIKSTIAPETTREFLLPFFMKFFKKLGSDFYLGINPEFLREGNAINDQLYPHVVVLGSQDKSTKTKLNAFYKKIYGNKIPIINTNFATSELIKYSNNAFLATKISFINSISNLCQNIPGANVDEIAKVIGMDSRIGPLFLNAGPGFGGSCLPKDLESLISICKNHKINSDLFESVKEINDQQIKFILKVIKQKLPKLSGKTISIMGLGFKENSDDIRASKSIELISNLLDSKCKINVYDDLAIPNSKEIFKNKISYFNSFQKFLTNSDCLILMHSINKSVKINRNILNEMRTPFIVDTRRSLKNKISGIDYVQIGVNDIISQENSS